MNDETLSSDEQESIDRLIEQFRKGHLTGVAPSIDGYLSRVSPSIRHALFKELVPLDRVFRGNETEFSFYVQQFPMYEPLLRQQNAAAGSLETVEHAVKNPVFPAKLPTVENYELLEEIAHGGMGVVYKAWQLSLKRLVAVKMIRDGHLAGRSQVQRFYTEAKAAGGLNHKGIIPVFDVAEHQGQHFYAMEFIDGGSLEEKIKIEKRLAPRHAAEIGQQVCDAIYFAHERGIIHRDLKPANIMLDRDGTPRISDFGLAKDVSVKDGLTVTGEILGTPNYMAPEQAAGKSEAIDHAADVYALGGILFAMLTGQPPFKGKTVAETLHQVIHVPPVLLRKIIPNAPVDLETIVEKCLEKEKNHRYSNAKELRQDLNRFLAGKPINARRTRAIERVWKWSKRNPVVTGLLATGIILAGAVLGVWCAKTASDRQDFETTKILVEELLTAAPNDIRSHIENLTPKKKSVVRVLRDRLGRLSGNERGIGLLTLAEFGQPVNTKLVEALPDIDNSYYPLFHHDLANDVSNSAVTIPMLRNQLAGLRGSTDFNIQQNARLAQLLTSLIQLGDSSVDLLEEVLQTKSNSIEMHVAVAFDELKLPARRLIAIGRATESERVRRLVALAVGKNPELADELVSQIAEWQEVATSAALYSACDWALRSHRLSLQALPLKAKGFPRNFFQTCESQNMIVITGPVEFTMGSPAKEPHRGLSEILHKRIIPRSFAVSSKEITVAEFKRFLDAEEPSLSTQFYKRLPDELKSPSDIPQTGVSWYLAAQYCNWLSRCEGIPKDDWAYVPNKYEIYTSGMKRSENQYGKLGYRLPSEAEWEYCCRAGSSAIRSFGASPKLPPLQVWYSQNSERRIQRTATLWPNRFGFFDMLGNVSERCTNLAKPYNVTEGALCVDDQSSNLPVSDDDKVRTRGASYIDALSFARSAERLESSVRKGDQFVGFRIARTVLQDE